jgi:A/G-specific adenine glycosylase
MKRAPGEAEGARRIRRLQKKLLAWYARARRDLPWRRTRDPYAIWVSEVMLQQTRVETVLPYYQRFLSALPSVQALAEAPLGDVLLLWSGLGYYRRARMLHAAAREVERERGGALPRTAAELVGITGIGRYTAGAVASIAWGEAVAVVDGNVARVLARLFAIDADLGKGPGLKRIWALADSLVVREDPSSWNQALMELGAVTCTPRHPRCASCPVENECQARARGLTEELPRARIRKAPELVRRVGFVLESKGRVLLARRPEGGLFGGMWEPPHANEGEVAGVARDLVDETKGRLQRAGFVTHVLSHRRIEMTVFTGKARRDLPGLFANVLPDYEAFDWVPRGKLHERPLTTLAKKILRLGGCLSKEDEDESSRTRPAKQTRRATRTNEPSNRHR